MGDLRDDGGGREGRRPCGGTARREGGVGGRERAQAQAQAVRAGAGVQTCVRAGGKRRSAGRSPLAYPSEFIFFVCAVTTDVV